MLERKDIQTIPQTAVIADVACRTDGYVRAWLNDSAFKTVLHGFDRTPQAVQSGDVPSTKHMTPA